MHTVEVPGYPFAIGMNALTFPISLALYYSTDRIARRLHGTWCL